MVVLGLSKKILHKFEAFWKWFPSTCSFLVSLKYSSDFLTIVLSSLFPGFSSPFLRTRKNVTGIFLCTPLEIGSYLQTISGKLIFYKSSDWQWIVWTKKNRAHEQFGYCQSGTSALLLDDDTAVIGTPGPYTWRGTVFAVSVSDDFLRRDKTVYYVPLPPDESPVDKYSYLGTPSPICHPLYGNQLIPFVNSPDCWVYYLVSI